MKVLITGANGFVGKNLTEALKNIRDGKDRRFSDLKIDELYLYDIDSTKESLRAWWRLMILPLTSQMLLPSL